MAAVELGMSTIPARVFPMETDIDLLLQTGFNQNLIHDTYVPETLYDTLSCIMRVEKLLYSKRIEQVPAQAGRYKPTMAEVATFISEFNKKLSGGSIGHYRQILRFGEGALEIIKEDSAKLEDAMVSKANAYKDGHVAQRLGFPKRKGALTPDEQRIATKYFELLAQGIVHRGSHQAVPYTGDEALHLAELVKQRADFEKSLNSRRDQFGEGAFSDLHRAIWEGTFDGERDFSKVIERSVSHPRSVSEVTTPVVASEGEVSSPEEMELDVQPPQNTQVTVEVEAAPSTEPIAAAAPERKAMILTDDFLTINLQDLGLFDCILTDPPYNLLNQARDSFTDDEKVRAFDRMLALLKPHGALIIVSIIIHS